METEVVLRDGVVRSASLTPAVTREPLGGVVLLHGAQYGTRRHPLYVRTARVLATAGLHVLAFDRRPTDDVLTLEQQAADAHDVGVALREQTGLAERPVGWWGWSQGGWVATLVAAGNGGGSFVMVVGYSIQSPAEQMRLYTRNLLAEAGHGESAMLELAAVRDVYEDYLRGTATEEEASTTIEAYRHRAWFDQACVPEPPLPDPGVRQWMVTFDPRSVLSRVTCRISAVWGGHDTVVDVEAGRRTVEELGPHARAHTLEHADHGLSLGEGQEPVDDYESLLTREIAWLLANQPPTDQHDR